MKKIIWISALCASLFLNESVMAQKVKVPDVDKKTYNELNRLLEEEKYEELEKKVRKNLEKKKSYTLLYFLAMSLYSQDKYNDEVKKAFEDLISRGVYEFEANSRLAVMYVEEKNYEKAKSYAIRAVEVGTEKKEELAKAYHNVGVCYEKI
ncbi:MAG: tetratricopeptide repeat protein, partial [Fervidobacterium sp.]